MHNLPCNQNTNEVPSLSHSWISETILTYSLNADPIVFYCIPLPPTITTSSVFPHLLLSPCIRLCCVCVSCLCGKPIWGWLRLCHWFRWHICRAHVCHQLLLPRLQRKASSVDVHTGWLICFSGHRDPWPGHHLLPLILPADVTLNSTRHPFSSAITFLESNCTDQLVSLC